MKPMIKWLACSLSLFLLACSRQDDQPSSTSPAPGTADVPVCKELPRPAQTTERVLFWNDAALCANAIDHTPDPSAAEQLGPTRTSRAFAIVHIAMFDAINALAMRYPSYAGIPQAPSDTSPDAAIAQAAHDTLVALYPRQAQRLDALLAQDLGPIPEGRAKSNGVDLGRRAAAAILALRANDRANVPDPVVGVDYFPSSAPGKWRPDPVSGSLIPIALGAYWYKQVHPFVLPGIEPFHAPPPPALTSAEYAAAFNEVKRLGGDGISTPTERTAEQTTVGIYWAYDGTPRIGARPRLYNQIVVEIARRRTKDPVEMARLLALVNVAVADACAVVWYDKYKVDFWRPVTAIREADPGTGPSGLGDGNPHTVGDPNWTPLGSPASNLPGFPNFTPPFPAYTSGHAGLGGAMFEILRRFYGTDRIAFSFVSDEFNGVTRDNQGQVRPRVERSFSTLSHAQEEHDASRIYLGVHFRFDVSNGVATGRRVADSVFNRGLVRPAN